MKIRGEEVLLPCSMIGGYPRPHWLQGRVFGSLHEPLYRSMDLRIAYEDAVRLAAQDQEAAGLDILADAQQYMPWETPAFQIEPIFHYNTEMLEGFRPWGPPNSIKKYEKFYMSECVERIRWVRPIFEGVLAAMKEATSKPFKIGCFGPGQNSVIVSDRFYNDNVALAMDLAAALNDEFKYLRNLGLEAIQIIDVKEPNVEKPEEVASHDVQLTTTAVGLH